MLSLVLMHLALAQAPEVRGPVAVVLTSKRPGAEQVAPKIAQRVFESFKREGVDELRDEGAAVKELRAAGFSDPKSCQAARACLKNLAVLLGPRAVVVGVDVGKVGKTLAIHLEAVAADVEEPLGALDVSSSLTGWSDAMSAPIVVFVRDVKAGLVLEKKAEPPPPAPVAVADAPTKPTLTPAPKEPGVDLTAPPPGPAPKVAGWVFAGGAVAAAAAAVTFAVLSGDAKRAFDASLVTLPDGATGSALPQDRAQALAGQANTNATVALGAGIGSAALAALAVVFFVKD